MPIETFAIYNEQLKRNIHFDLLEDGYYSDLILNDCDSCPTGIAETDHAEELKTKALMFIYDTLNDPNNYQQALSSADFFPFRVNNTDLVKDYSGSLLLSVKKQCVSKDCLLYAPYKSDFINNVEVTADEQNLLDKFADFLAFTNHDDFDSKLSEFENQLPEKLTLRELNLARLNQRILLFNACICTIGNDHFYDINSLFFKDFYKEHNLTDYFPALKKTEQSENLIDLCIEISHDLSDDTLKKKNVKNDKKLSFSEFLKPKIALECLKVNHYAFTILSNVVFSHFINTHSLFLSERALNIFISEQPILSTAKDFKEIPEKLLNPTLNYIKNVLNLAVKPQFYNSYSKSFSLKK